MMFDVGDVVKINNRGLGNWHWLIGRTFRVMGISVNRYSSDRLNYMIQTGADGELEDWDAFWLELVKEPRIKLLRKGRIK